uniref:YeiH family protein n=1 Tax=Fluviicola sp. TaxID=1917219 RepID=UPI00404A5719
MERENYQTLIMSKLNGIVLAIALGLISFFLANYTPSAINSVIIALIIGISIGNTFRIHEKFNAGISFTSSKLLELSILFLAFDINYSNIAKLGAFSFLAVAVVLFSIVIITVFVAKKFNCPGSTGWLIGFGTAICGSSAIAALAPSVSKNKEDVAVSMAVVNLYGTIGMLLLPMILIPLQLSTNQMGLLLGGSLHSIGNVAGAGFSVGEEVGEAAITIKLARVALLTPGLILMNFLINRKKASSWKDHFKLPWYLIGFIGITILGTFVSFPDGFLSAMETIGKVVLTIAMGAIGLKVNFKTLLQSGRKGLGLGLFLFALQVGLLFIFSTFI